MQLRRLIDDISKTISVNYLACFLRRKRLRKCYFLHVNPGSPSISVTHVKWVSYSNKFVKCLVKQMNTLFFSAGLVRAFNLPT